MVSIVDYLPDGLSSVYTFYEPERRGASFAPTTCCGRSVLPRPRLPYLLGYWIRESPKMRTSRSSSDRRLVGGAWRRLRGRPGRESA